MGGQGGSRVHSFLSGATELGYKWAKKEAWKGGKIGHAGILAGNEDPKVYFFLSGAAVLADEGRAGPKRRP